MSFTEISIPENTAFFEKRVDCDGVSFLFDFSYNQRADCFYLEIKDELGDHLLGPIKLVSNWALLHYHRYVDGLPLGELLVYDPLVKTPAPGLGVLGKDVRFYYLDAAGVADTL